MCWYLYASSQERLAACRRKTGWVANCYEKSQEYTVASREMQELFRNARRRQTVITFHITLLKALNSLKKICDMRLHFDQNLVE